MTPPMSSWAGVMANGNGLTDKRQVFVEEYLKCWNGAEAARRAEYAYPRREAHRLLTNADIAEIIQERIREKAMGADEVLAHLADIARFDMGSVIGKGGVLNLDDARQNGSTGMLKSIQWTKGGVKVEAYDKLEALEKLGKHLAMWVNRHEITGADGSAILIHLDR